MHFSGNWHPTNANGWIYEDSTATNTLGRKYFDVHNNYISQPDPLHHPNNTNVGSGEPWRAARPFMPVPGSNVGVAISRYGPTQDSNLSYSGFFPVD
jgi:hypothetical protein